MTWLILFPILTVFGYVASILGGHELYWLVFLLGVPIVVAPLTYRRLVGGACSVRFRVCALVKGIMAGVVFVLLSFIADVVVWSLAGPLAGWSPMPHNQLDFSPYYAWFLAALVGGFAARVAEVRGRRKPVSQLKVSGFE